MKLETKKLAHLKNCLMLLLLIAAFSFPAVKTQAAARTGTYQKHFSSMTADSYRTVIIKKITKTKVVFQMGYDRSNPYKISYSSKITGKRKGNKVTFTYKEPGWNAAGKGTMKLSKNYIKIKTTSTKGYGFLGTGGAYFKLKRISGSKKFVLY